jgi:hypothetical protein
MVVYTAVSSNQLTKWLRYPATYPDIFESGRHCDEPSAPVMYNDNREVLLSSVPRQQSKLRMHTALQVCAET